MLVLLGLGVFCAMMGWAMVARGPREIAAGRVEQYRVNEPRRLEVEQLNVSSWIRRRGDFSQDVVYVMRDQDEQWRAYLGMDTLTGCFLTWDPDAQLFKAINDPLCLGSRYTPDGRYLDGQFSGEPSQPMALLPVEIRDGNVVVLDQLVRVSQ
jgi:Rieske Fe-S protein